jgi:hypothetical protein
MIFFFIFLFIFILDMNKLCQILNDNINLDYDIAFYIKQSDEDFISYNYNDPYETIEYICDKLTELLINNNQDIIIDYNNNKIILLYNYRRCTIIKEVLFNNCLYWILYINLI